MAKDYTRTDRIGDQLQRELAQLIQMELKDPRLGMVTVSGVKISRDLSYADIHVTVMGKNSAEEAEESVAVLNAAAGFLKGLLSKRIKIRLMPKLRFHYDNTTVQAGYISSLIDKAVQNDQATDPQRDDPET